MDPSERLMMETLIGSEHYCLYQGRQYVIRSGRDLRQHSGIVKVSGRTP